MLSRFTGLTAALLIGTLAVPSPVSALRPTIEDRVERELSASLTGGLEETPWDKDPESIAILAHYPDPAKQLENLPASDLPIETLQDHVTRVLRISQLLAQDLPENRRRLVKISAGLHDSGRMRNSTWNDVVQLLDLARTKVQDRAGQRIPLRARDLADHYGLTWRRNPELISMLETDLGPGIPRGVLIDTVRDDITTIQIFREMTRRGELTFDSLADEQTVEAVIRASVWAGLLNDPSYRATLEPGVAEQALPISELLEVADVMEASTNLARLRTYRDRPRDLANVIRSLDQKVAEGAISRQTMARALRLLDRNDPRHAAYMQIASESRRIGTSAETWSARDQMFLNMISEKTSLDLILALALEPQIRISGILIEEALQEKLQKSLVGDPRLLLSENFRFVMTMILREFLEDIHKYGYFKDPRFFSDLQLIRETDRVIVILQDEAIRYHDTAAPKDPKHPSVYEPFFYRPRIEREPDFAELVRRSEAGERGGWGIPVLHGYYAEGKFRILEESVTPGIGIRYVVSFPFNPAPPQKAGAEETPQIQIGAPILPNGLSGFEVIPVEIRHEGRQTSGRAVLFDPQNVLLRQPVNPTVAGGSWNWQTIRNSPPDQHPGVPLTALVADPERWGSLNLPEGARLGLAMHSLQTNFWEPAGFLVADGKLAAIPGVAWPADPWVLSLDAGNLGLRQLSRDAAGIPQPGKILNAIAGPVLIRSGQDLSGQLPQYAELAINPNAVRWDPASTTTAFSAIGRTQDNRIIAFSLAGRPEQGIPQASVRDVARMGLALGAVDLILLGGSMDVQQWVAGENRPGVLGRHNSAPHGMERRLNAAILVYQPPDIREEGRLSTHRAAALLRAHVRPDQLRQWWISQNGAQAQMPPGLASLSLSDPDETWVETLVAAFSYKPAGALPAAQAAGLVPSSGYRTGPFSRNELRGPDLYLEEEWLPAVRRTAEGVAQQLATPRKRVTTDDLGLPVLEEMMTHLFRARDTRPGPGGQPADRLFIGFIEETDLYRWAYREIPRLLVPALVSGPAASDARKLTEALENPFRISNDESNLAVRGAIAQLIQEKPAEFSDNPAVLQADPAGKIEPWVKLTLASNLIDYSRESILEEIRREGLAAYILARTNTPFLPELGADAGLRRFIEQAMRPGTVLVHFTDNNGEAAASLKLDEILLSANPALKIRTVMKGDNGAMNDASVQDGTRLLQAGEKPDLYARLREYQRQGRFAIVPGPRAHGMPLDRLPPETISALSESTLVLAEGEANTWTLRGLNRETYLALRLKWPEGVTRVFGLDLSAAAAAQRPPAFVWIDGSKGPYYRNPFNVPSEGEHLTIAQTVQNQIAAMEVLSNGKRDEVVQALIDAQMTDLERLHRYLVTRWLGEPVLNDLAPIDQTIRSHLNIGKSQLADVSSHFFLVRVFEQMMQKVEPEMQWALLDQVGGQQLLMRNVMTYLTKKINASVPGAHLTIPALVRVLAKQRGIDLGTGKNYTVVKWLRAHGGGPEQTDIWGLDADIPEGEKLVRARFQDPWPKSLNNRFQWVLSFLTLGQEMPRLYKEQWAESAPEIRQSFCENLARIVAEEPLVVLVPGGRTPQDILEALQNAGLTVNFETDAVPYGGTRLDLVFASKGDLNAVFRQIAQDAGGLEETVLDLQRISLQQLVMLLNEHFPASFDLYKNSLENYPVGATAIPAGDPWRGVVLLTQALIIWGEIDSFDLKIIRNHPFAAPNRVHAVIVAHTAGLEEKPLYANEAARFPNVLQALLQHQVDRFTFYPHPIDLSDASSFERISESQGTQAVADAFLQAARKQFADQAVQRLYSIRIRRENNRVSAEIRVQPQQPEAGLEGLTGLEVDTFLQRHPDQVSHLPDGTKAVLILPDSLKVTFYRPETLAEGLNSFVREQKEALSGLKIDQLPLPSSSAQLKAPAAVIWDNMLGELPYSLSVPVISHRLGEPFPYPLAQMVAIALFGTEKAVGVRVLSAWTFDVEGQQVLAIALSA